MRLTQSHHSPPPPPPLVSRRRRLRVDLMAVPPAPALCAQINTFGGARRLRSLARARAICALIVSPRRRCRAMANAWRSSSSFARGSQKRIVLLEFNSIFHKPNQQASKTKRGHATGRRPRCAKAEAARLANALAQPPAYRPCSPLRPHASGELGSVCRVMNWKRDSAA